MTQLYLKSRKLHTLVAWLVALPMLVMLVSGVLLQQRDRFSSIQPPTKVGSKVGVPPKLTPDEAVQQLKLVQDPSVEGWKDVQQVAYRPSKGTYSIRLKQGYREVQVDAQTGEVLLVAVRNTGLLTDLHEGEWFSPLVRDYIFKPSGILLLGLWFSGLVMMLFPKIRNWGKAKVKS